MTALTQNFKLALLAGLVSISAFAACPSGMQEIIPLTTRTSGDVVTQNACYDPTTGRISYITPALVGTSATNGPLYTLVSTTAIAGVNAGTTLLAGFTGRAITIVDITMQALGGAVGTCTAVVIQSTNGTPVVAVTNAIAALTQNALLRIGAANSTAGAGWGAALGTSDGIAIAKTGGTCDTATSIKTVITYSISGR